MLVVTGGAGFVGSNLIQALNQSGQEKIFLVDDLTDASKIANLADLRISDYADKDEFLSDIERHGIHESVKGVFHQGACSDTMATDGRDVMSTNYVYSKKLFLACARAGVSFIYASSASVYGREGPFRESGEGEQPLNAYAYSKFLFDRYVSSERANISNQVVGLMVYNIKCFYVLEQLEKLWNTLILKIYNSMMVKMKCILYCLLFNNTILILEI